METKVCLNDCSDHSCLLIGIDEFLRGFEQSIARLCSYIECLQPDIKQLNSSLKHVSGLAENISGRVAALDQSKGRVVECLQLVNDLLDLRTCAEGVQIAMRTSNYDEAAQHIHRFLTLDSAVFKVGDQLSTRGMLFTLSFYDRCFRHRTIDETELRNSS